MEPPRIHSKRHRRSHHQSQQRLANGHDNTDESDNQEQSQPQNLQQQQHPNQSSSPQRNNHHHHHHRKKKSTANNNDGDEAHNHDVTQENNENAVPSTSNINAAAAISAANSTTTLLRHNDSIASTEVAVETNVVAEDKVQKGILGYMDRQLKVQNVTEPPRSPAQRSTRSRSSNEKSPRRKRSKSESRRRRERKILAAGELEVRQANETLMRYLKQCSDFNNDASLSGDLEIDENLEDRRVHRKTKAQRQKKQQLHTKTGKEASSDLTTVLNDLAEDVRHGHDIYNPFTPVVSPLDGPPTRIDKLYIQTSSGYRAVDNNNFYKSSLDLDADDNGHIIRTGVHLSCCIQRIWILLSNICHGLLAGLGLAHLLLIYSTKPLDWLEDGGTFLHYADFAAIYASTFYCLAIVCMVSIFDRVDISRLDLSLASETIRFRWIIVLMVYAVTITLSLCCSPTDERLYYLTTQNMTTWTEHMESNNILSVWNSLSIAKSFGAIIGWIFIGLSPNTDRLYSYLLEMEKYQAS